MRRLLTTILPIAVAALLAPLAAAAGQSAATLYALNCLGCHLPPEEIRRQAPRLVGQFAQTESGRIFFIRLPDPGEPPLSRQEDARLVREIFTWKASCHVILQGAPLIRYSGGRFVK